MTSPLPPMGQDPSIVRGQQLRAAFTPQAQAIRADVSLDELAACEKVILLWSGINDELATLYQDLQSRRQARLNYLETIVPVGPNIPAGTSPADTVVLNAAFRTALAEARNAVSDFGRDVSGGGNITPLANSSAGTLAAMLTDAEKFDDDNLRRAVLTAALEQGRTDIVQTWTDKMGVTDQLAELADLRRAIAGEGIAGQWNFTVFEPLPEPDECDQLPRLIAARNAATEARVQMAVKARNASSSYYPNVPPVPTTAPYAPGQGTGGF